MDHPQPVPMERMLGALLRIPFQAINERIVRDLVIAGYDDLRPTHFQAFQHLPASGARLSELAERAQITKQSMAAIVNHLVEGGYLERVPDPSDGRAQVLRRTPRGWDVERVARLSIQQLEVEWGQQLGHDRMQQCRAFLIDLAELLDT